MKKKVVSIGGGNNHCPIEPVEKVVGKLTEEQFNRMDEIYQKSKAISKIITEAMTTGIEAQNANLAEEKALWKEIATTTGVDLNTDIRIKHSGELVMLVIPDDETGVSN